MNLPTEKEETKIEDAEIIGRGEDRDRDLGS